ncbi:MAG TPA: SPOR domain-containing protein [Bacteroidales bacterium]|nr:SPOR domain-containing protein [Bacteroidales bacterium]
MLKTSDICRKMAFSLVVLFCCGTAQRLCAQRDSIDQSGERFIQLLQTSEKNKGTVRIFQDRRIVDLVGSKQMSANIIKDGDKTLVSLNGWRIQIFSGNNQATAKEEAFSKEALVKAKLPDLNTYVIYNAPFWRVRVGDFFTYEEAYEVLLDLRRSFVFGREMSIVREKIQVEP